MTTNQKTLKERIEAAKTLLLGDLWELGYRAHSFTSFSPEVRACSMVEEYSKDLQTDLDLVEAAGGDVERYKAKYIEMLSNWQRAKGNCISSMITGGSNFPVARAQKANDREHSAFEKFYEWQKKAMKAITKQPSTDIRRGESDTVSKLQEKLEAVSILHARGLAINKIVKSKKIEIDDKILAFKELGLSEQEILDMTRYNCTNYDFLPVFTTSTSTKMRNLKKDIIAEENRAFRYADGNKEHEHELCKIVENAEANRLQLIFDGKPEGFIITELKRNGFRWSPKNGAWQRQLTGNALFAVKHMQFLKKSDNG